MLLFLSAGDFLQEEISPESPTRLRYVGRDRAIETK